MSRSSSLNPELNVNDSKFYLDITDPDFELFYFNLFKSKHYPKGTSFKKREKIIRKLFDNIISPIFLPIIKSSIIHRIIIKDFIINNKNKDLFKSNLKHFMQVLISKIYKFIDKIKEDKGILIHYKDIREKITIKDFSILLENFLNIRYNKNLIEGITSNNDEIYSNINKLSSKTDIDLVFDNFYYKIYLVLKRHKTKLNITLIKKLIKKINKFLLYIISRIIIDRIKNPNPASKGSKNKFLSNIHSLSDSQFFVYDDDEDEPKYENLQFELLIKKIYPRDIYIDTNYITIINLLDNIFNSIFKDILNNDFNIKLLNEILSIYTNQTDDYNTKLKKFKNIMRKLTEYLFSYANEYIIRSKPKINVNINNDDDINVINKDISIKEFEIFLTNFLNMRFNKKIYDMYPNREIYKKLDIKLSAKTNLNLVYKHFFNKLKKFASMGLLIQEDNNYTYLNSLIMYMQEIIMYLLSRILIYLIDKQPQISKRLKSLRSY